MFIKIEKNNDGSRAFQIGGVLEDGWVFVPDDIAIPDTFPFVNIKTEMVTHPATETREEYTQLEVVSMTNGEEIKVEEPVISSPETELEAKVSELEEQLAAMKILLGVE